MGLPAGVAYLRALADKSKGAAAMNGSVLPMPANEGLVWRGIGPLPAMESPNSGHWSSAVQGCNPPRDVRHGEYDL